LLNGNIFFIFTLITSFSLLVSYFKLTNSLEVLSTQAASCSHLSLIVEGQGVPEHAIFYFNKQIFTQPAKIAALEHHSMTMWMLVSKQNIDSLLTSSVLLCSIPLWTFIVF